MGPNILPMPSANASSFDSIDYDIIYGANLSTIAPFQLLMLYAFSLFDIVCFSQ